MSKSMVLTKNERLTGNSETRVELGDDVILGIWNLIRFLYCSSAANLLQSVGVKTPRRDVSIG